MAKMVDYEKLKEYIQGEISRISEFETDATAMYADNSLSRECYSCIETLEDVLKEMDKNVINIDKEPSNA